MSTISGISSASSAWSSGATSRAERMFAKVDADGSGGVDKTELQGMLDHIAEKGGASLGSADDVMTKLDADGNGSVSSSELDAGMKSLMPPPSSTMEFAQRSGGSGGGGGSGGPPPPAGDASSSDSTTDPLDTNGDGTVSAAERAAGDMMKLMKDLTAALDTFRDQSQEAVSTLSVTA